MDDAKKRLIQSLRDGGYLKSDNVIRAFEKVDREKFMLPAYKSAAYSDYPLPIPGSVTMSAPHMHAIVLEALDLKSGDSVLEVGFGSGILLAYISEIVGRGKIIGTEINNETYIFGARNLERAGYKNVILLNVSGANGVRDYAPYDKIAVSAAAKKILPGLVSQLNDGGRMVIPVGRFSQDLMLVEKNRGKVTEKNLGPVVFVTLTEP
ncbi:MAG: protein-L-isoaspartate O-methyltransferase [Candidatus Aenigmatarchaeota archaeon]